MRASYTKQSKRFSALRCDQRLRACPVSGFVETLLQFKQPVVLVCIGQKLSAPVSIEIFFLQKEVDEISLPAE